MYQYLIKSDRDGAIYTYNTDSNLNINSRPVLWGITYTVIQCDYCEVYDVESYFAPKS